MTEPSNDISLIHTDELIEELMNRHDHAIFSGVRLEVPQDGKYTTVRRWKGNSAQCSGLCSQLSHRISHVYFEESTDMKEMI